MFQNIDNNVLLWFNSMHSEALNPFVIFFTTGTTWIPLYVLLIILIFYRFPRRHAILFVAFAIGCVAITSGVNELLVKPLVARPRPLHNEEISGLMHLVPGYIPSGYSFFSSHSANTSTIAVFISQVFRNRWVMTLMLSYCLVNAFTRLYLCVHYPSDVLVGLTFGTLTAFFMYRLAAKTIFKV